MQQPCRLQAKMREVQLVQGVDWEALETRVEPETLPAMVSPAIWKASVVLAALLTLAVPTPRVALAALLARVVLVPPTVRVALVPRVARRRGNHGTSSHRCSHCGTGTPCSWAR